jgi:hypothetical protein
MNAKSVEMSAPRGESPITRRFVRERANDAPFEEER